MKRRFLLAAALAAAAPLLNAATARVAVTAGARDLLAGESKGTAVSADGRLTLAPPLAPRAWPENAADAAVFAAAGDGTRVYVATGGGLGRLFVSDASGVRLLFTAPEPNLTAVAVAADGTVVCAASPNGKVYRVNPKATDPAKAGEAIGDPKEAAIWALAFGPDGTLYAGTGNKGRIYRRTASGAFELFHEIEDVHVRTLLVGPDGTVYAGTSDRGLVVAIPPKGGARTLHDFSRPEVTGLALDGKGVLYASASQTDAAGGRPVPVAAPPRPTPTPTPTPAPEEAPRGAVSVSATTSAVRPPTSGAPSANNSEIVAIAPDGFVEPAWVFPDESIFSIRWDAASASLLVSTSPRGRLYAWKDRSVRLLTQTGERTVVAAPASAGGFAAVTSGSSGVLRPAASPAAASYLSAVKDAARLSTFRHARWDGRSPAGSAVALSVRSGNSEKPDATWSAWTPVGADGGATVPAARFFQWKADLKPGPKGESPSVERVELTYSERNARPVLENVAVLEPGVVFSRGGGSGASVLSVTNPDENGIFAGLEAPREGAPGEGPGRRLWRKGFRTLTWKGTDPNGDALRYDVEARRENGPWFPVRKDVEETFLSFDTTALADGRYVFRVTASDRVSHAEGEALTASEESTSALVDNTPPVLKLESRREDKGVLELRVLATDALSPVVRAEGAVNADRWRVLSAEDGAADSPVERFVFRVPRPAGACVLAVRVVDASGNVASLSAEWP